MVQGKIHSLESFGTVDGPGLRFVVFMQGCPLRCLYCHNPDTWDTQAAPIRMTPDELLQEVLKYKSFILKGGVTLTGGEPLLQAAFVRDFFRRCHEEGIHTAIDTSGFILNDTVKEALQDTDLVLLDIKSIDADMHPTLTGVKQENSFRFLDYLQEKGIDTWIRHVVVPGYTDNDEQLKALAAHLRNYTVVKKVELLPYHTMGIDKYTQLGLTYPLKDVQPLTDERLKVIRRLFD